jgi:hypothetical protein
MVWKHQSDMWGAVRDPAWTPCFAGAKRDGGERLAVPAEHVVVNAVSPAKSGGRTVEDICCASTVTGCVLRCRMAF